MEIITSVLHFLGLLILVLMVFNLMIVVHELGHFLAARWRGLKVDAFQVWFGKPLWKKTINGVQYGLGCIPAGGFVKLPQMAPMDAIEGKGDEPRENLPPISYGDKIIVAFAGPLFSFLLACFFAVIVWKVGKPESEAITTTEIGYVQKDGPADKAGLKPGDKIESIDGKPVRRFHGLVDSVQWLIVSSEEEKIQFQVQRDGKELTISVLAEKPKPDPATAWWKSIFARPPFREVGIMGRQTPMVGDFMGESPWSPAEQAGIKQNDLLLSVDGETLRSPQQLIEYVEAHPKKELSIVVQRKEGKGNVNKTFKVTPRLPDQHPADSDEVKPLIGVKFDFEGMRAPAYPKPWEQIKDSCRTMWQTLSKIASRKSDVSPGHLSGFIGISRVFYTLLESQYGWQLVMWFSVVLNVNLAILNLLPFPVLDGGHIVMALIEAVRRRPINIRLLEVIQTAAVILLFGFMIFVSLKDTGDIMGVSEKSGKPAKKDDPKAPQVETKFLPPDKRAPAPDAK